MIRALICCSALLLGPLLSGCVDESRAEPAAPRPRGLAEQRAHPDASARPGPAAASLDPDHDPELSGRPSFLFRAGRRL
jgi:hypothetical protein